MISFDFSEFWKAISPRNIAEKATGYSIGGVPIITYGFIGVTAVLLGTVHLLDTQDEEGENPEATEKVEEKDDERDSDSKSDEIGTSEEQNNDESSKEEDDPKTTL